MLKLKLILIAKLTIIYTLLQIPKNNSLLKIANAIAKLII
jgi:hypothetical protein